MKHNEKPENVELFTQYFKNTKLGEDDNLIWLKFKFSEAIVGDILENVHISLNCIPAVSMNNSRSFHRVTGRLNIIPIISENSFLDLD
ncbi:hypothetical protein SCA31_23215, partial [Chryseobacterium sp. SIMBA_028]